MVKTKTSIHVDQDLWREFGAELRRKGMDYSQAIERLARGFLDSALEDPKRAANATRANKALTRADLHRLLDEIIDDGTQHLDAIQQNLELLAFALRFVGRYSLEELRELRRLNRSAEQAEMEAGKKGKSNRGKQAAKEYKKKSA